MTFVAQIPQKQKKALAVSSRVFLKPIYPSVIIDHIASVFVEIYTNKRWKDIK